MEFTQENFDKLLAENANKEKAFQEEREKRKQETKEKEAMQAQLTELQDFKKDLEEKEAKKKGKYEEIIAEKDAKIEELTKENTSTKEKAWRYDEYLWKELSAKLEQIPEDKREFVGQAIDGKTHEEKLWLLDVFIKDYTSPDFKAKPKEEWKDPKDTSKYEEAKKKWDVLWMIANAPEVKKDWE